MANRARLTRLGVWIALAAIVAVALVWGARHLWQRLGAAADVTEFTPADADAVIWIPRVDEFTEALVVFTRGVQEAARLRELLEPETGVDLGDPEGLRRVGVDPEAGFVVFSRAGMVHFLLGVEDADTFIEALVAKFANLGYPEVVRAEPDADGIVTFVVPAKNHKDTHAAFAADDGLLVLVFRGRGRDPQGAVRSVLGGVGEAGSFFETEDFREVEERLGKEGPLMYANGGSFARDRAGNPKLGLLDELGLPPLLGDIVRERIGGFLGHVRYAAARASVGQCAASVRGMLRVNGGPTLLPQSWLLPDTQPPPSFGKLLPRDTVLMTRLALNLDAIIQPLAGLARLASGLGGLASKLGLGKSSDPIAEALGTYVHPDLADRHVVRDLFDHLTGHISVSLVGLSRKAMLSDLVRPDRVVDWLAAVQLVVLIEVERPAQLWEKWWEKRTLLGALGFEAERMLHPEWRIYRLERGCKPTEKEPRRRGRKKEKPMPCERYGMMLAGNVLVLTTGEGTLERVVHSTAGHAADLYGLTREPAARSVLGTGSMLGGAYFSFDGLLKSVRNRNLPGGATRYFAQMFELALTLQTSGGDARAELLLTR